VIISEYYADAEQIPYYAINGVAEATKQILWLTIPIQGYQSYQPATRGRLLLLSIRLGSSGKDTTSCWHVEASKYIVRTRSSNQTTQTVQ
jgi:hypothetical protein